MDGERKIRNLKQNISSYQNFLTKINENEAQAGKFLSGSYLAR